MDLRPQSSGLAVCLLRQIVPLIVGLSLSCQQRPHTLQLWCICMGQDLHWVCWHGLFYVRWAVLEQQKLWQFASCINRKSLPPGVEELAPLAEPCRERAHGLVLVLRVECAVAG